MFLLLLYGNNEEEVIIREVKRDFEYEAEMVFLEQYFWENHVQRHVPPPYTESGALIIESARKHFGPADKNAPAVALDLDMTAKLMQYLRLLDEKKNAEVYSKEIDKDIQRLKALLIAEMGTSCTAVCEQEGVNYTVTYTPVRKSIIDKDNLLRLKLEHPDIYEQFVTVSESRRFSVRASIMEALSEVKRMNCIGTYDGTIFYNPANKFCIVSVKTADQSVPAEARSNRRTKTI